MKMNRSLSLSLILIAALVLLMPVTAQAAPSISVTKTPANQTVMSGAPANFTISVTNTGDVMLTPVIVQDFQAPECSRNTSGFLPGRTISWTCSHAGETASYWNLVSATGYDLFTGTMVRNNASARVTVIPWSPALSVTKVPANQTVMSGAPASWTITVANTGNTDLNPVRVWDGAPECARNLSGGLAAGVSTSYTCSHGGRTASYQTNTTAAGYSGLAGRWVNSQLVQVRVTVTAPPPVITSVAPNTGVQGTTVPVTIQGANFVVDAAPPQYLTIEFTQPGTTNSLRGLLDVPEPTSTTIHWDVIIPAEAATGAYDLKITNPDGQSGTLPGAFTVTAPPPPVITSVTPNTGVQGTTVAVTIQGANFVDSAQGRYITIEFAQPGTTNSLGGGLDVPPPTSTTYHWDVIIPAGAATGAYDLKITNPDGQSGTLPGAFTVTAPLPTLPPTPPPLPPRPVITSVTPNYGVQGTTVPVTIEGANFVVDAPPPQYLTIEFTQPGTTNSLRGLLDVPEPTSTTIHYGVIIPAGAATGAYDLTITNPDGQSGTLTGAFKVIPPLPPV